VLEIRNRKRQKFIIDVVKDGEKVPVPLLSRCKVMSEGRTKMIDKFEKDGMIVVTEDDSG